MNTKTVFVLGGFNGFLGKAIVRYGREHGYVCEKKVGVAGSVPPWIVEIPYYLDSSDELPCRLKLYSINRQECNLLDPKSVMDCLTGKFDIIPDIVLYTAAKCGGVFDNLADPFGFWHENTLMALNTLKAVKESAIPAFVAVLSSCIYPSAVGGYEVSRNFGEDKEYISAYPLDTISIYNGQVDLSNVGYAAGKRALLDGMISLSKQCNTQFNALVPCNMFGVGDTSTHFIPSFMRKLRETPKGETIVLNGTGSELRQFMDVDDCAGCIIKYLQDLWNPAVHMRKEFLYGKVWVDNVSPDDSVMTVAEAAQRIVDIADPGRKIAFNGSDNCQFRKDITSDLHYNWTPFDDTIRKILV